MIAEAVLIAMLMSSDQGSRSRPTYRDYPFQEGSSLDTRGAFRIDALAIVQPIRRLPEEMRDVRMDGKFHTQARFNIEEVRVLASDAFAQGTVLRVVHKMGGRQIEPSYPLDPSANYVLIAKKQSGGELAFMTGLGLYGPDGKLIAYDESKVNAGDPAEVAGLSMLWTKSDKLSSLTDPGKRLMDSVADSLVGASDEEVRRASYLLAVLQDPDIRTSEDVIEDAHPLIQKLKRTALTSPPRQRARIFWLFVLWHVRDSETLLMDALAEASSDPTPFSRVGNSFVSLDMEFTRRNDKRRPQPHPDWSRATVMVDRILASNNAEITRFFIYWLHDFTEPHQVRQFAGLVNHKDRGVREAVVRRLGSWSKDPTWEAKIGNGYEVTNLDELVEHWRQVFNIPPPP